MCSGFPTLWIAVAFLWTAAGGALADGRSAGGALAGGALADGGSAGGASADSSWHIEGIDRAPVAPGAYTTVSFRVANSGAVSASVLARVRLPAGWWAVTPVRSLALEPQTAVVVPFSVRSDPHARADSTYPLGLTLTDEHGRFLAAGTRNMQLVPTSSLRVRGLLPPRRACPGDRVDLGFRVINEGNVTVSPRIEVETVPVCPVEIFGGGEPLEPGRSAAVTARVHVRESLRPGQPVVVEVRVATRQDGELARERVRMPLDAPRIRVPTYRRLPTEVQTYHERTGDGRNLLGLRLNTGGRIGPDTQSHLDLHLLSGDRTGAEEGWRRHRLRLDLARRAWKATAGDLQRSFSDLTLRTLWGRGLAATWERERTRLAVVGMDDRDPHVKTTYALAVRHQPGHDWSLDGEWSLQREPAGLVGGRGNRSLLATRAAYDHDPFGVSLTGAGSVRAEDGHRRWGRAAQLRASHQRPGLKTQLRAYAGSREFAGANRDRDGWFAHLRWTPRLGSSPGVGGRRRSHRPLSIWVSHDAQRGVDASSQEETTKRTRRLRGGGQLAWGPLPSVEVTAGHERVRREAREEDLTRRDLQVSAWETIGRIMVTGFTQWGDIADHSLDRTRPQRGWGLSAGGRAGRLHGTLRWSAEEEYLPETGQQRRRRNLTGDLMWSHPRGRWLVGLGVSSRRDRLSGGGEGVSSAPQEERMLRPCLEWRVRPGLTLRYEQTLREEDGTFGTETARLQLTWASDAGLPVVWQPLRAGIAGIVFVDENLDGRPDPGETAVADVAVILEGRQFVTDQEGRFENEELEPGVYWLDLNPHTLPPDLVPLRSFPMTVTIDPGQTQEVWIPLARATSLFGVVYRDRDHNGRRSPGEPGVRSVLVELRGADGPPRNAQTDETGAFRFQGMVPGSYRVELAHEWLPREWTVTGEEGVTLEVSAGGSPDPIAFGIAPEEKPIIRTYSSGEPSSGFQDTAPAYSPAPSRSPHERPEGALEKRSEPDAPRRVLRKAVSTGVLDREPCGIGDRFATDVRTIYFFTEIANPGGRGYIEHVWYYRDEEMARVLVPVGGPTWRTWSSKHMLPEWTGSWRVQVVDEEGRVLAEHGFEYGEATPNAAPNAAPNTADRG